MADMLPSARKSLSITEQLSRMHNVADEESMMEMMEMMDNLQKEADDAAGFRHHSAKTQARQDSHLKRYRGFVRAREACARKRRDESLNTTVLMWEKSDEEIERIAFPADHDTFYNLVRLFLIWLFNKSRPKAGSKHIEYGTLDQYRTSIMFWAARRYGDFGLEPPPRSKLYNQMTEAMRSVHMKKAVGHRRQARMPFLGLGEIRQLIDHDMVVAACMEVAEQHHLAWCIGRQTAVRAASLAADNFSPDRYVRWRDIEITTTSAPGDYKVVLNIIFQKTSHIDPESGQHRDLTCYLDSPTKDNLIFSIPHRLLVIALRRGLLLDINSLDELLSTDKHHILIKPEHLDDPVFYAATKRGLHLHESKPLQTGGLREYLRLRCRNLGYTQNISFHAIRRAAATDLVERVGRERTRELLGHAPESCKMSRSL